MSTFYGGDAYTVTANAARHPVLHTPNYYKSSTNQRSQVRESTWAPCSAFSHNYRTSAYDSGSNNVVEIHRNKPAAGSVALLSGHTANTNRVITFHSSACWRDYFQASKKSDKLIVIYFTASWCAPCRYMAPTLDEFAAQYTDVEFDKIDVDELFSVSQEFGVQAMPAFLFIKKGKEIDRVTGAKREELQRKIEKYRAY